MTFELLSEIIQKNNIPADVHLLSDSGWECSETEMDGVWYNKKENIITFTQEEQRDPCYHPSYSSTYHGEKKEDWTLLYPFDMLDEQMGLDAFLKRVESDYQDAKDRGFDSIVIAIDTDVNNTYYINDMGDGFQCDFWDYYFDDLCDIAEQLYDKLQGNITDIRIE